MTHRVADAADHSNTVCATVINRLDDRPIRIELDGVIFKPLSDQVEAHRAVSLSHWAARNASPFIGGSVRGCLTLDAATAF